ncbi:hypothetical protein CDAR_63621 [Caerostris darwini]|uniref:Uncharacterized protein n=1 Tax=Caerostris darwini TaxID=1538125 RepID=A0AAV4QGR8_9ARAC|nr:hypothetical protein CDAR_63621 [Caerostris darwini]
MITDAIQNPLFSLNNPIRHPITICQPSRAFLGSAPLTPAAKGYHSCNRDSGLGVDQRCLESLSRARREAESLRVAMFVQEISFVAVNHDGATALNLFTPGFGSVDSREIASAKERLMVESSSSEQQDYCEYENL